MEEGEQMVCLTDLPEFVIEEIFLRLESDSAELFRLSAVCRVFQSLLQSDYFQVRYWRLHYHVWDVLRYKRSEESWSMFCCRSEIERDHCFAQATKLTTKILRLQAEHERAPDDAALSNLVAFAYSQRGLKYLTNLRLFETALEDFKKASSFYTNAVLQSAWNNRAVAYLYLGNLYGQKRYFEMAEKALKEVEFTGSSISLGNMCCTMIKLGRFEEALRYANIGTKVARGETVTNANIWHHKAFCLYSLSLFRQSEVAANRALRVNKEYSECYFTRGLARRGLGRAEEAQRDFETALKLSRSSHVWAYVHMYCTSSEPTPECHAQPRFCNTTVSASLLDELTGSSDEEGADAAPEEEDEDSINDALDRFLDSSEEEDDQVSDGED